MNSNALIRCVLWFSALFNLGGALLFAFPASPPGQLVGMPVPVQPAYCGLLALFVILFGGAYAWLAMQPEIDRPLLAFGAIGKACAFVAVALFWAFGEASGRTVLAVTGDLVLAALFFSWLFRTKRTKTGGFNPPAR
jgi:hypothetical protein